VPFFTYRSLDALREDIARRGHAIQFASDNGALAAPLRVGPLALANRLVVHPMEGCDANLDGTPGELTFRRWRRFADGGAALLWGEATAVAPEARANPRQLLISRDTLPELRRLVEAARAARKARFGTAEGFAVGMQLTHSGRWSHAGPILAHHGGAIDAVRHCEDVPLISDAALEELEDRFVAATVMAHEAGFDFVDIKQCHTYLLNELLAARSRPGPYGGDFASRTRFVRNVFGKIRALAGDRAVLATRLNVFDGVPHIKDADGVGTAAAHGLPYNDGWGVDPNLPAEPDLSEPVRLIQELRALGIAMVNVSMGSPYYNPHVGRPFERAPVDGYAPPEHPLAGVARHFDAAAQIQRAFPALPIVGTGYSWLRHFALHAAAANVAAGDVSLVGLGRGALAYPDFAADALAGGGMQRDKACIGVSYCTALMRAKHNSLGQYATGCVPRDRLYAAALKEANRTEGWA
jgi:2,4-dienoyl-CoA reductase-like NADH-dependent reductase (Old Yellow Enzyme family)